MTIQHSQHPHLFAEEQRVTDLPKTAGCQPKGVSLEAGKNYAYCTCGLSAIQPFCDGTHRGTGFSPIKFNAVADEEMMMCMCKRTSHAPRCDGSHKTLTDEAWQSGDSARRLLDEIRVSSGQ